MPVGRGVPGSGTWLGSGSGTKKPGTGHRGRAEVQGRGLSTRRVPTQRVGWAYFGLLPRAARRARGILSLHRGALISNPALSARERRLQLQRPGPGLIRKTVQRTNHKRAASKRARLRRLRHLGARTNPRLRIPSSRALGAGCPAPCSQRLRRSVAASVVGKTLPAIVSPQ